MKFAMVCSIILIIAGISVGLYTFFIHTNECGDSDGKTAYNNSFILICIPQKGCGEYGYGMYNIAENYINKLDSESATLQNPVNSDCRSKLIPATRELTNSEELRSLELTQVSRTIDDRTNTYKNCEVSPHKFIYYTLSVVLFGIGWISFIYSLARVHTNTKQKSQISLDEMMKDGFL